MQHDMESIFSEQHQLSGHRNEQATVSQTSSSSFAALWQLVLITKCAVAGRQAGRTARTQYKCSIVGLLHFMVVRG